MSSVHLPPSPSLSGHSSYQQAMVKTLPSIKKVPRALHCLYTIHFRRSVFENMVSQCYVMLLDDGGKRLCWCYHGPPWATITTHFSILVWQEPNVAAVKLLMGPPMVPPTLNGTTDGSSTLCHHHPAWGGSPPLCEAPGSRPGNVMGYLSM